MDPIFLKPGEQIKQFMVHRKSGGTSDSRGRVKQSTDEIPEETLPASIAQSNEREINRWAQIGHPISHTLVHRGRSTVQAEDILMLDDRRFYVQGKNDAGGLGIFEIIYVNEDTTGTK